MLWIIRGFNSAKTRKPKVYLIKIPAGNGNGAEFSKCIFSLITILSEHYIKFPQLRGWKAGDNHMKIQFPTEQLLRGSSCVHNLHSITDKQTLST